jgi:adenylate cyclase
MKKKLATFIFICISSAAMAQIYNSAIDTYWLIDELFKYTTDNLDPLFLNTWESAEILEATDWFDSDELSGEDFDRSEYYWKYFTIPKSSNLESLGKTDIVDFVIIIESYEVEVRLFVSGKELFSTGIPVKKRIGYQYYTLPEINAGTPIFFKVESNPFAGEEIYLADQKSITNNPGKFQLLHVYQEMVPFIFGVFTLITGIGMFLFFIIRFSRKNWYLLWFGLFSIAFGVFTLFNTTLNNVLVELEPVYDFYITLLAQDLLPVFLLLFYISFMEKSWQKLFLILITGQFFVLFIHLFIMITGFYSEWSDILSILFPMAMFITVTFHLILRNRKNKFSNFFYSAFLILALRYGVEFLSEIGQGNADSLLIYGSILFYFILGSLPYYSYLLQGRTIKDQNIAFRRFVPNEFLDFLSRKDITGITLGDHKRKILTILFTDIRSFTSISEQMTPEENFKFINRFLGAVGPVIRNNRGFVDKYIGDAVMAIFPDDPEDSINAGLQILEKVSELNISRDPTLTPEVRIGIGIHTGDTMLGIIGEKERYDSTVISDAVNLASRLESLTKRVNVPLLMSEATAQLLDKDSGAVALGLVTIRGKADKVKVFTLKSLRKDI